MDGKTKLLSPLLQLAILFNLPQSHLYFVSKNQYAPTCWLQSVETTVSPVLWAALVILANVIVTLALRLLLGPALALVKVWYWCLMCPVYVLPYCNVQQAMNRDYVTTTILIKGILSVDFVYICKKSNYGYPAIQW